MADSDMAVMEPETAAADAGGVAEVVSTQLVVSYWLADAPRSRLAASGAFEIVDDPERVGEAALIVISTRVPAGSSPAFVRELRARVSCPIVAIVHPGGEDVAVDLLAGGASSLVAEGNEEAVAALLELNRTKVDFWRTTN